MRQLPPQDRSRSASAWKTSTLPESGGLKTATDPADERRRGRSTPRATLPQGPRAFADYFELRDRIAEREDDFARGFTEALIGYSLGRPFGFTDEDLADEILTAAKAKQYSVSEFVQTLVISKAFRTK